MPTRTISGILADIAAHKQEEVQSLREHSNRLEVEAHERKTAVRPFRQMLDGVRPAVIAEVKKASPSRGVLIADFHPARIAHLYEEGGAACLSVLTDHRFFEGSLTDLEAARAAVTIPVLRKDFTLDRVQVFEAAAHGADAILLIAALHDADQLRRLRETAESLGLTALVEVHDAEELALAIDSGASLLGVNNRDLNTFQVSLDTSIRLSYLLPPGVVAVSESGITSRADIELLWQAGYKAVLVGESLMRSADPSALLETLTGVRTSVS